MRRLQNAQDPVPAGCRSGVLKMRKAATAGKGAGLMDAAGERRHKKIPLLNQVACTRQIMASSRKSPIPGRNSAGAPIYERPVRPSIACLGRPVNARMAGTAPAGTGSACPVRDRAACVQVTAHGQEKNALAGQGPGSGTMSGHHGTMAARQPVHSHRAHDQEVVRWLLGP